MKNRIIKLKPVAQVRKQRFVLNSNGEPSEIVTIDPPILPSEMDYPKFPSWSMLSCDEILKEIERIRSEMMVIRVDAATYQTYLDQIDLGNSTYASKCGTSPKLPPIPVWSNLTCDELLAQIEIMRQASISISDPVTSKAYADEAAAGKALYTSKCGPAPTPTPTPTPTPGDGGFVLGPGLGLPVGNGGGGGGGGAETKEKPYYSWLWLVLIAAGVYMLASKDKQG